MSDDGRAALDAAASDEERRAEAAWAEALADPGFIEAIERGAEDEAAGRVVYITRDELLKFFD